MPFVTRVTTSSLDGFASSRFGPTVPVAPASASVWQPPQPALVKTALPAVAIARELQRRQVARVASSRSAACPTTVSAVAVVSVAVEAAGAEQAEREREQEKGDDVCPAHHGGV